MLEQSRLTSFIDQKAGFTIHYFDGQSVIRDLALIHNVKGDGFRFFRDAVLTFFPLVAYLKNGESFGFYIDSNEPWFRFKLEANTQGYMRTLLSPDRFDDFPQAITGFCRLSKIPPGKYEAYNSVVELNNLSVGEIANLILKESYQVNAYLHLSQDSDQAILFQRLPDKQVDRTVREDRPELVDYVSEQVKLLDKILKSGAVQYADLLKHFNEIDIDLLTSTEVSFKCACSRDRMIQGIASLTRSEGLDGVFEGKETIETKCDYCQTHYLITRDEVTNSLTQ